MYQKIEQALLFLTILFLPTQLGRHFWPDFSFVYSLPIDYLSPTIYFWDLIVVCLMSVSIIRGLHFNKIALNLFLLFIFSQVISLMPIGKDVILGAGLVRLEQYLVSGLFGVYLASNNFKTLFKAISLPLLVSIFFESFLAIWQFSKGATIGFWILGERTFSISTPGIAKFDYLGTQFLRPYSTFSHPNVLAAFLLVTLPLVASKFGTIIGSLALFLTASRSAILLGFFMALNLLNKKWKLLLIITALILSPVLYTRFSAIFSFDSLALIRREELAIGAVDLFLSTPLSGVGLNNFIEVSAHGIVSGPSRFLQPVHNIYLLSLSETGIIGFCALLFLIGYPLHRLLKLKEKRMLLVWSTVLFLGLFDHYFLTLPQGYRLTFLIWGLSCSMLESKNAKSS